jgi:hypothetical protein
MCVLIYGFVTLSGHDDLKRMELIVDTCDSIKIVMNHYRIALTSAFEALNNPKRADSVAALAETSISFFNHSFIKVDIFLLDA